MKKKFRFLAVVMAALVMMLGIVAPSTYATGTGSGGGDVSVNDPANPERGVLSGYASYDYYAYSSSTVGTFPLTVSGSWSAFAGWTVKTNFGGGGYITVYLTRPDGSQIGNIVQLDPTDEHANMSLWNVPTGTYQVHYSITSTYYSGSIQVWIY